jgi:hypothetical protein
MKLSAAKPAAHNDPLLVLPIYIPPIAKSKGETQEHFGISTDVY